MDLTLKARSSTRTRLALSGRYDDQLRSTYNPAACVDCGALVPSAYRKKHDEFHAALEGGTQ